MLSARIAAAAVDSHVVRHLLLGTNNLGADGARAVIAALPPAQRDAFLLQHEGGLSLAEIAALTGVGAETVKSRLRYAIAKLRSDLATLREASA